MKSISPQKHVIAFVVYIFITFFLIYQTARVLERARRCVDITTQREVSADYNYTYIINDVLYSSEKIRQWCP